MPFNGSGTFVSVGVPDFPAVPGEVIFASRFNTNMNDIFTNGLTKCITRDGQSVPTANLPMGTFRHTGVGNAVADTDYAAFGQVAGLRGTVGAVDWDSKVTTGIYDVTAAALTGPATNFPPTSEVGQLQVYNQGANIIQCYYTAYRQYQRRKVGAAWTSWGALIDQNIPEIVASAATVSLGDRTSTHVTITGTTTITSFGTVQAGIWKILRFSGSLTITHNATSLIMPNNANFVTQANDFVSVLSMGSGNWICFDIKSQTSEATALDALATNGMIAKTGSGTVAARTITGTANQITVSNGDGVSGNPTLSIPDPFTIPGAATVTSLLTTPSGINNSGGQIQFPAVQNASAGANTLDDYEEGSWTPTLTFATPGNLVVGYNLRQGQYTKIGNLVNLTMRIQTSSFTHTTASGVMQITGLPFTCSSASTAQPLIWTGISKATYTDYSITSIAATTRLESICSASGAILSQPTAADMPTGGTVELTSQIQYMV